MIILGARNILISRLYPTGQTACYYISVAHLHAPRTHSRFVFRGRHTLLRNAPTASHGARDRLRRDPRSPPTCRPPRETLPRRRGGMPTRAPRLSRRGPRIPSAHEPRAKASRASSRRGCGGRSSYSRAVRRPTSRLPGFVLARTNRRRVWKRRGEMRIATRRLAEPSTLGAVEGFLSAAGRLVFDDSAAPENLPHCQHRCRATEASTTAPRLSEDEKSRFYETSSFPHSHSSRLLRVVSYSCVGTRCTSVEVAWWSWIAVKVSYRRRS